MTILTLQYTVSTPFYGCNGPAWPRLRCRPQGRGPCVSKASIAETQSSCQSSKGSLDVTVCEARSLTYMRAAAALRARSFYSYPGDRSAVFAERHRKMRIEDEYRSLENKTAGTEPGFSRVTCLVALCDEAALLQVSKDLDYTSLVAGKHGPNQLVVGTLDLNLGLRLPGEELTGHYPKSTEANFRRAYLSNVCVAQAARRKGVAIGLMKEASCIAVRWGVEELYVHVIAANLAAKQLYEKGGFCVEQQESPATAHLLHRPARLLLRKSLYKQVALAAD